jgi:hypothetical protein
MRAIAAAKLNYMKFKGSVDKHEYMIVVNYSEPSYRKRLYVLKDGEVLRSHHVAHGSRSACGKVACKFSNKFGSHKSSLGAMKTGKVYYGKYGKSLKLRGLDKEKNGAVYKRFIVLHSSNYVTNKYIMNKGRAGCSWGCLSVDPAISSSLIDLIKGGCFVFTYA